MYSDDIYTYTLTANDPSFSGTVTLRPDRGSARPGSLVIVTNHGTFTSTYYEGNNTFVGYIHRAGGTSTERRIIDTNQNTVRGFYYYNGFEFTYENGVLSNEQLTVEKSALAMLQELVFLNSYTNTTYTYKLTNTRPNLIAWGGRIYWNKNISLVIQREDGVTYAAHSYDHVNDRYHFTSPEGYPFYVKIENLTLSMIADNGYAFSVGTLSLKGVAYSGKTVLENLQELLPFDPNPPHSNEPYGTYSG
jgi:hypothetical protein